MVEDVMKHLKDLLATWSDDGRGGATKSVWFDVLCDVMELFQPLMMNYANISMFSGSGGGGGGGGGGAAVEGGDHNTTFLNKWRRSMSHQIIEQCRDRINRMKREVHHASSSFFCSSSSSSSSTSSSQRALKILHIDDQKIQKLFLRMKRCNLIYDDVLLEPIETCLSEGIEDQFIKIERSFETNTSTTCYHRHHPYYICPITSHVKQLSEWRRLEIGLQKVIDYIRAMGEKGCSATYIMCSKLRRKTAVYHDTLGKAIITLGEKMIDKQISVSVTSGSGVKESLEELLVDIVCLKKDLLQLQWLEVDSVIERLVNKIFKGNDSFSQKSREEINAGPNYFTVLHALNRSEA